MKRIFCVWLAILLCIFCTACGDPTPEEINEKTLKVVLVCEGDDTVESSQAAVYAAELKEVTATMGIKEEQIAVCDGIAATDTAFAQAAVRSYIKDGYSVVFSTSVGYTEAMKKLAAEFPRVTFIQVGDADETLPNFYAYRLKAYEGAYLCGLVAGELAENGVLGMVVPAAESAENYQMANAFLLGARAKKPQAKLLVSKADTADGSNAVSRLQQQGCEGLLLIDNNKATLDFAEGTSMRLYTVYGSPDTDTVRFGVTVQHRNQLSDSLQAVLSKIEPYYNDKQVGFADGFLQGKQGFEEDGVYTGDGNAAIQALWRTGTWDVFSGVSLSWDSTAQAFAQTPTAVKDTEGTVRIAAGAGLPSARTLNEMLWWMEGITVQ